MDVQIKKGLFFGKAEAPPSKSMLHRMLLLSGASDKKTKIYFRGEMSQDIKATVDCIEALGGKAKLFEGGVEITPILPRESALLDCGESGTTLRLLIPYAAALGVNASFIGRGRLPTRPNGPLISALRSNGVEIEGDKALPLEVRSKLTKGSFVISGDVSSQYISALLVALAMTENGGTVELSTPLQSAGYVEMTVNVMRMFGSEVTLCGNTYTVKGKGGFVSPGEVTVNGDWSNSAFFLAMGALGGEVSVSGLSFSDTQGDRAIFELLRRFGADVSARGDTVVAKRSVLRGISIDARDIPDLVCVLSVVASAAFGKTVISGISRLRHKESDRVESTVEMIRSLGGRARTEGDAIVIEGNGSLNGGTVDSFNDHRIAMSAAVAGALCREGLTVRGAECVKKSFPNFFDIYKKTGGEACVI